MDGQSPVDDKALSLRREVEPPLRQSSGLGLMLVASVAMFFAVASSAFWVRARMDMSRCPHRSGAVPAHAVPAAQPAPNLLDRDLQSCGEAVYRRQPDGNVVVSYQLCPPSGAAELAPTGTSELAPVVR